MRSAEVRVELPRDPGGRSYAVAIGGGHLERELERIDALLGSTPKRAFIVADSGVAVDRIRSAQNALARRSIETGVFTLEPSERMKTLETTRSMLIGMERARLERGEPVIGIGGGIVGDVAGFAAASYRRGTPIVQCPTTLLAMVDASVGGKTGVNLEVPDNEDETGVAGLLKNAVGAFHQPARVVADVSLLQSLPSRVLRSGLAECLKHGLIAGGFGDAGLFEWTVSRLDAFLRCEPDTMVELVRRNVAVKAAVVAADERETAASDGRALLNLGHTFAHAIEPIPTLSPDGDPTNAPLTHGEAVGLGLIAAAEAGRMIEGADDDRVHRVRDAVASAGLPTAIRGIPRIEALIAAMKHDKKTRGGVLRIVPSGAFIARTAENPPETVLRAGFAAIQGT